ncbi:set domain-containing 8 [Fusarium longipes]|uniref:Set domain-containing 8 n=1 Tax=Fusarium longipes TaxID=694270 RepID=A0A395RHT7_9HYPO|nr:set domain-containing 8 [Fusarium longipes]
MPPNSTLSVDTFPIWARFNDVDFINASLRETDGKGIGLVAVNSTDLAVAEEDGSHVEALQHGEGKASEGIIADSPRAETRRQDQGSEPLLRIPHDLILSATTVEEYTKVDQNFRQLIDSVGHNSARGDILLYLLAHLVLSGRDASSPRGPASTPWTEYLKFLPRDVPVPTMWSEVERTLLQGTSLEAALEAKLSSLNKEFEDLVETSSAITFWNSMFWDKGTVTIQDWILVDAWYRSRCLELPQEGNAMVPGLDMANHSCHPTAYYDQDDRDDVVLLVRPGNKVSAGDEINISYGEKTPAEMLFSYGFIDSESTVEGLTLPMNVLHDDPLGRAKLHIFGGPASLKLSRSDGKISWQCPFAYLMCLNEEDGLEFKVLQGEDGERELRLFWQEEDVTTQVEHFEDLIKNHPLCQVFRLRVVAVLHEMVSGHLAELSSETLHDQLEPLRRAGHVRDECLRAAERLRRIEVAVLESAASALNEQSSGPGVRQDDGC